MSRVQRLASAPGVRLAVPLGSEGRPRPLRRRAALALSLLAVAVPAALVASRTVRQRRAASATVAVAPREAPHATVTAAEPAPGPAPSRAAPRPPNPPAAQERVFASTHASALFARHSWYVAPPPRPAPPPPPPPEPTAPPLPFTFLGSYAHQGDAPVFFLARRDRVIDAHVGDQIDGVYQLESAAGSQLVFVYLPLNVRQNLAARVSP